MTVKPYKSPLGFFFTAEEEAMYRRAIMGAVEFFKTYGRGTQPRMSIGLVHDERRYTPSPLYYDEPVGSLQVMEQKAQVVEEEATDYMPVYRMRMELGAPNDHFVKVVIAEADLKPRVVTVRGKKVNLYRLSQVKAAIENRKNLAVNDSGAPELTTKDILSGKWMRPYELARQLGIGPIGHTLSCRLNKYKVPYAIYVEKTAPHKYYNIDVVRERPFIRSLIKRYT